MRDGMGICAEDAKYAREAESMRDETGSMRGRPWNLKIPTATPRCWHLYIFIMNVRA